MSQPQSHDYGNTPINSSKPSKFAPQYGTSATGLSLKIEDPKVSDVIIYRSFGTGGSPNSPLKNGDSGYKTKLIIEDKSYCIYVFIADLYPIDQLVKLYTLIHLSAKSYIEEIFSAKPFLPSSAGNFDISSIEVVSKQRLTSVEVEITRRQITAHLKLKSLEDETTTPLIITIPHQVGYGIGIPPFTFVEQLIAAAKEKSYIYYNHDTNSILVAGTSIETKRDIPN